MEVTPKHPWYAYLRWPLGWLCDQNGQLSTSKIMAFALYTAYVCQRPIPPMIVAMLITASFGYSMWKDFKDNFAWKNNQSSEVFSLVRNKVETINENRQVVENRNVQLGFDPSKPKPDPTK